MSVADELRWLAFFVPRRAVEVAAARLPLAALRDRLPAAVAARLRLGLYPARVTPPRPAAFAAPATLDRRVSLDASPRASVLLVTHGNVALTRMCLASLQRAAGAVPFEVIAVNNASPDATAALLDEARAALPLTAILNRANLGFAAATNQAAARARGDVLVFLNNDTVVTPGWLDRLVAHLDADATLGLVGPTTNACGHPTELGAAYHDLDGMLAFAAAVTGAHAGVLEPQTMLPLFCAAMPAALFREAGGLDEGYGLGMFEDDDLAERLRQRGRRVALARDAFVHHHGGAAFGSLPRARYLRLWWQNRRRFEARWGRWQPR